MSFMSSPFQPGSAAVPSARVELSISAKKLINKDIVSKSDPVCVVFRESNGKWFEQERTEVLRDTINPVWAQKIIMDYRFEERQTLKFAIYDIDSSSNRLDDHDYLGHMICSLGEIMSAQHSGFSRKLAEHASSCIVISGQELVDTNVLLNFQLSGKSLDKKDFFGKSDPYYEIHRATDSGGWTLVHRSEIIKKNLNPVWKPVSLSSASLCLGNEQRQIKFSVWDWDMNADPDYIGSFQTSLARLREGEKSYKCINEQKKAKKGAKYKDSGTVQFDKISFETQFSFLDFITSGTQLNFTVAIDFTGSNGIPTNPASLHYRDPSGRPNQYQTSIQAVGEIIQDYDSDRQFPALGFGARIPPNGEVSHEFFLNMNPENPFCNGLEGVMSAYLNAINQVQLFGPTNFSPVINHVAKFASAYQNGPGNYFVLLILTDGIITDMQDTKMAIVNASQLPMSIIIVGVGDADFDAMEELDADGKLLQAGGRVAKRDIVQFVEMSKFVSESPWNGQLWNKEALAQCVLAEVPRQLTDYMRQKGYKPNQFKP